MSRYFYSVFVFLVVLFFGLLLVKNFGEKSGQHFVIVAEGFLEGRVDMPRLDSAFNDLDVFSFKGKYYWPAFPFPAVLLVPFVYVFKQLGVPFYQGYLQFFLTMGIFAMAYKLAKIFRQTKSVSLVLAFTLCFASNYSFLAFSTESWYFSQTITVFLVLLAFYEWYTKRRLLLIGIYMSLVLATRFTAVIGVLFFILEILFSSATLKGKVLQMIRFLIPLAVVCFLLIGYNYIRFGNIFITGYENNNIKPDYQALMLKRHGTFKIENVPTNIYWYFLALPDPILESPTYHLVPPFFQANPWGMSFFIMSPIFFLILKTLRLKMTREEIFLWIASGTGLSILLLWYSTGFFQVGPRYLMDILPLWFILLLIYFKSTTIKFTHYLIVFVSSLLNLFWISPYR